jgi:hypothetical protein
MLTESQLIDLVTSLIEKGHIPAKEFIRAYDEHRSVQKQTPQFATLAVDASGNEIAAVREAVRQARQDHFFIGLWSTLLDRSAGSLFGNVEVQNIAEQLYTEGAAGTMQSVLRSEGFRYVKTYPALMSAARATGLVTVKGAPAGTGFLIGPDLVMTAAHVVLPLTHGEKATPDSENLIEVQFFNQLESPGSWPIRVRPAKDWLVMMSPPHGIPPALQLEDPLLSLTQLDFVVIRLAKPIGNDIGYVDIRQPASPEVQTRLTVIGYPGGSECVSDDALVVAHNASSGRVHHGVNTKDGMSGGPCLDYSGSVIAIQEGAVTAEIPNYNRAVHLTPVRKCLIRGGSDLLEPISEPLWSISDADARREWVSNGQTLLGKTDEAQAEWLDLIGPYNLDAPAGAQSGDSFHPVFGRAEFQKWIDSALPIDAQSRIAMMSGAHGVGKSFSARLLRAKLRKSQQELVYVSPETTRSALAIVLDLIYAQVSGSSPSEASTDNALRPPAGVLRRDVLPDALEDIRKLVTKRPKASARLWLAIDFGEEPNLAPDLTPWKQFLIEAEKQPWLRVVMMGLTKGRYEEFLQVLANRSAVFREPLNAVSAADFEECLGRILKSVAPAEKLEDWQAKFSTYWDSVDGLSPGEGRTVEAVRMALNFRTTAQSA